MGGVLKLIKFYLLKIKLLLYLFFKIIKMAKVKAASEIVKVNKLISRPGIHAKTKVSKLKSSKNYKKLYRGQGK